ncbi:NusG domain II-containing protein [Bengtsoniella intestinalis]|uniref:NusG domain II-containing protein n=1 Tax=Bengtsoniella intestinalis TaxID=3073143 RepID=UPI00391EF722
MTPSPKQTLSLWDGLVALVIVALAVGIFFWQTAAAGTGDLEAVIAINGQTVETIALSSLHDPTQRTYTSLGYTLELELSSTAVTMTHADCPDQDCVHTGTITQAGQSIVCLPARLSVRLLGTGASAPEIDVVIG